MTDCILQNGLLSEPGQKQDTEALLAGLPAERLRFMVFDADGNMPETPFSSAEAGIATVPEGGGFMAVDGSWYVEPVEAGIDFLKSADARSWMEYMLLRQVARTRLLDTGLTAVCRMNL